MNLNYMYAPKQIWSQSHEALYNPRHSLTVGLRSAQRSNGVSEGGNSRNAGPIAQHMVQTAKAPGPRRRTL